MGRKFKFKSEKAKDKWQLFGCGELKSDAKKMTVPRIELFGNREVILEGCTGVTEYTDSYLKLKLSKGSVILTGAGFDISAFEGTAITVRGKISSLEFCI